LVVSAGFRGPVSVSSITYGALSLTRLGAASSSDNAKIEMWYLLNPSLGANTTTVTFSGSPVQSHAGAISFSGVNQATPFGSFASTTGNSATPSLVVTSAADELVLDVVSIRGKRTFTEGSGQSKQWEASFSAQSSAQSTEPGSANVTMSWTASEGEEWAQGGVSIKSATILTQEDYRWYANINDLTPTSSLAFENTAITGVADNALLRLRLNVSATGSPLAAGEQFRLQYSNNLSGPWTDVGGLASSEIWRGYDNPSAFTTDGATLTNLLLSQSGTVETYEENNPSAGMPNSLPVATTTLGRDWFEATANADWGSRSEHASAVYNNKMWVMGGLTSVEDKRDVWSSTDGVTWTQLTGSTWVPRQKLGALFYDNRLWVVAGCKDACANRFRDVHYYTDGGSWVMAIDLADWTARADHTVLSFDNRMWVIGGQSSTTGGYLNDVWHSTNGSAWTQATPAASWSARARHASIVFANRMWVIGGEDAGGLKNDVWYSADGSSWTQATANAGWPSRRDHTVLTYDRRMWVIGGATSTGPLRDVWYSSDGVTWTQATASAAWVARDGHTSVIFNNRMWVMGGEGSAGLRSDVWYSEGNGVGEWDWVLQNNGALHNTTYYFRLIRNDGSELQTYLNYPTLTTVAATPLFTQRDYRWFRDVDTLNPSTSTDALAPENTPYSGSTSTQIQRLRMNLRVTNATSTPGQRFKLQFATALAGPWTDVGAVASATIWRGADKACCSDGASLTALRLASSTVLQSYEEENNSTSTPNAIAPNGLGEWDWVLQNNNAPPNTYYYFRMVQSNGTPLNAYANYPTLNTGFTSYATSGSLVSSIFDTRVIGGATINAIIWQGQTNGGTVRFQLASGNSLSGPWTYVGPDGTANSFYGPILPNISQRIERRFHFNHRYLRYRVLLDGSGTATPVIQDIILNWSP
jgi:hypothetical protein